MKRIDHHQQWKWKICGEQETYEAVVPGSVYTDLLRAGRMEDPYYRNKEDAALALMQHDFEYRGTFDAEEAALLTADEVLLRFEGIDTIADIALNDVPLGKADNMHRVWEFPVRELLKPVGNELVVTLYSPVNYIAAQHEADPGILGTEDAMRGFPKIRKGHFMFGWDWGPRLPDAGIWKPVMLLAVKKARLTRVYFHQEFHEDLSEVTLSAAVTVSDAKRVGGKQDGGESADGKRGGIEHTWDPDGGLRCVLSVWDPDGKQLSDRVDAAVPVTIDAPRLWWPNGLGAQPLYTVRVELLRRETEEGSSAGTEETGVDDGAVCGSGPEIYDVWERRIGLRKMEMSTAKDDYGSEFAHVVNGVKFFAMGADYIPEDNLLPRCNAERTRTLLEQCTAAHFNCIRVWGGGLYPSDAFYDACDELGLVVWQDFMFACANYRLTTEFEASILAELTDQIRRLSHHASLGLWCGNNEMEMFAVQGEWGADDEIRRDYLKMYEDLFPRLLSDEDPDRFYWPASPSSGGGFDAPNDENRGDVHYWEVWHGNKPFTEYRKFYFRYLSEFGFQSFPSIRTVESFTLPEDRNVFSYVMEKHQRNASANGKIMNYMEQTFLYPNDLDTLIYASQLLQAEAIRYGVEHFRRNRGRCMGTIYWQLNDCWPVASWSSIDYYGRWKALHYYAKRFFAPVLLSCEEEGLPGQTANVNAEPFPVKKSVRFNVSNESLTERHVTVAWQLRNNDGAVLRAESRDLTVPPLSAQWLDKVSLPEAKLYEQVVTYQLFEDGAELSSGSVLFCAPKHFHFLDPHLSVRTEGDEIVVTADRFAKSIEIRNASDDLILSDNFFDLPGVSSSSPASDGTPSTTGPVEKRVRILKGQTDHLEVRSMFDIR
ncbi:MAG: glycoside hydrolase family 2 protein [Lachnospiraceae bacterium]|nr:glycoside hydrolase family 2 protein [Lachnospiraceae bacterium]